MQTDELFQIRVHYHQLLIIARALQVYCEHIDKGGDANLVEEHERKTYSEEILHLAIAAQESVRDAGVPDDGLG